MRRIAVIGGGVSGLSCAHKILELLPNAHATVFDMGRSGPGGRASTRWRDGLQFDHGCQFVRIEDSPPGCGGTAAADFAAQMQLWQAEGAIARWDSARLGRLDAAGSAFTPRSAAPSPAGSSRPASFCRLLAPGEVYVGTPGMDALCQSLAAQHADRLTRVWSTKVSGLEEDGRGGYTLSGMRKQEAAPEALGAFDAVVLSDAMAGNPGSPGHIATGSQAVAHLLKRLGAARAAPRISLMVAFPAGTVAPPFDAATVAGSDAVEWLSHDSAKPGRPREDGSPQLWTAVSTEAFAAQAIATGLPLQVGGKYQRAGHKELASVTSEMVEHVAALLAPYAADAGGGSALLEPLHASAQRWGSCLYPLPDLKEPEELLAATEDGKVVAVGDWLSGSEVQRAVRQAHATARVLCGRLAE